MAEKKHIYSPRYEIITNGELCGESCPQMTDRTEGPACCRLWDERCPLELGRLRPHAYKHKRRPECIDAVGHGLEVQKWAIDDVLLPLGLYDAVKISGTLSDDGTRFMRADSSAVYRYGAEPGSEHALFDTRAEALAAACELNARDIADTREWLALADARHEDLTAELATLAGGCPK